MSRAATTDDAVEGLLRQQVDRSSKALPPLSEPITLGAVGEQGWHALDGDLPWPIMVLKDAALEHNIRLMADFCRVHGLDLAPHGKTTMAPQLVRRQLQAGAWGVTAATATQARVFHRFGVRRIILANEVVDPAGVRWASQACAADPDLELCCLVDSVAGVQRMDGLLGASGATRGLPVLVELGVPGRRAGCRTTAEALDVAAAVAASRHLELAGVEAFEGVIGGDRDPRTLETVDRFLRWVRELAETLMHGGAFAGREEVMVSVGGSLFPDRVADVVGAGWQPPQQTRRILRSGCYLTHDHGLYAAGSPFGSGHGEEGAGRLRAALEVWGSVLSRPEPDLAIVGFGKRDVPYDAGLPVPLAVRDHNGTRRPFDAATVTDTNDQHAFVRLGSGAALEVGELLGCGISHPCTAFDKWPLVPLVDDDYRVVGAVRTFF